MIQRNKHNAKLIWTVWIWCPTTYRGRYVDKHTVKAFFDQMLYIVSHLSNLCLVPMGYWEDGALMLTYADNNADIRRQINIEWLRYWSRVVCIRHYPPPSCRRARDTVTSRMTLIPSARKDAVLIPLKQAAPIAGVDFSESWLEYQFVVIFFLQHERLSRERFPGEREAIIQAINSRVRFNRSHNSIRFLIYIDASLNNIVPIILCRVNYIFNSLWTLEISVLCVSRRWPGARNS